MKNFFFSFFCYIRDRNLSDVSASYLVDDSVMSLNSYVYLPALNQQSLLKKSLERWKFYIYGKDEISDKIWKQHEMQFYQKILISCTYIFSFIRVVSHKTCIYATESYCWGCVP